jgi:hypothetical protein
VDAVHHVHNESCLNFTLGTPADLANAFVQTWPAETRPEFVILERQMAWKKFYRKHSVKVKGFTKTKKDPLSVHGFRFQRDSRTGVIAMHWKEEASESAPWRGVDSARGGAGFQVLRSRPGGVPVVVEPRAMKPARQKALFHATVKKALDDEGMEEAYDWLATVVRDNGKMTINRKIESQRPGDLGDLVVIGTGTRTAEVRVISTTPADFWGLPPSVVRQPSSYQPARLPNVQYADPLVVHRLPVPRCINVYLYLNDISVDIYLYIYICICVCVCVPCMYL